MLLLFNTTRAHNLRTPKHGRAAIAMDGDVAVLLLSNTTCTTSGLPSTGAAIAMDGGVAVDPTHKNQRAAAAGFSKL